MIRHTEGPYALAWLGMLPKLGTLHGILRDGEIIHRGSIGYIRVRWRKLTGKNLPD